MLQAWCFITEVNETGAGAPARGCPSAAVWGSLPGCGAILGDTWPCLCRLLWYTCDNLWCCFGSGNKCQAPLMSKCLCTRLVGTHLRHLRKPLRTSVPFLLVLPARARQGIYGLQWAAALPHCLRELDFPADASRSFSGMMTSCWDGDEWKCLIFHRLRHRNLSLVGKRALWSKDVGLALKIVMGAVSPLAFAAEVFWIEKIELM